jgi:beta-glucosidase
LRDEWVESLISRMSPGEKLGQLTQIFSGRTAQDLDWAAVSTQVRKGEIGSLIWAIEDVALRNRLQEQAVHQSRLGIPLLFGMDVIHGARTIFPLPLALSCAFRPELFERTQGLAARESLMLGLNWMFAPICDLARDPRWGRVAETCGEDPFLASRCVAAQVRGLQGEGAMAACLKHFVGYGAVLGGRDYNEAEVGDWTLRNMHFPMFRAGVEAGAFSVMSSFNSLQGIPMAANRRMLRDVLKNEWQFPGFVVSDWRAVAELVTWGFARDRADAARLSVLAGNDVDMLSLAYRDTLEAQILADPRLEDTIDEAVRRVLLVKAAVGLFRQPFAREEGTICLSSENRDLARECVQESAVLLKNDGVLPLAPGIRRVALIGPFADDREEMVGCWAEWGKPADVVTLADGLRDALDSGVELQVVKGCAVHTAPQTKTHQDGSITRESDPVESDLQEADAVQAARSADVVIMAIGEPRSWTGEAGSRASLGLTGHQHRLFDVIAAEGKPMVSVVFSGRPLTLPEVWKKSAAVLYAWQPGIEAGPGLAALLTGVCAPSGRLTMSVLADVGQAPMNYNQPKTGRPGQGQPREGHLERPAFPFGHGLTYTTFAYGAASIRQAGPRFFVQATVENTGPRPGVEVVQLYVRQLACHAGVRPRQELRGFQRVFLEPGERREVSFELNDEVLGYWTREGRWNADPGEYHLWIAPSASAGDPVLHFHDPGASVARDARGEFPNLDSPAAVLR